MKKATQAKSETQAAEWAEKIRDCQSSGLSVTRWCAENEIAPKTYYYHLKKLREKVCGQIPVAVGFMSENNSRTVAVHAGPQEQSNTADKCNNCRAVTVHAGGLRAEIAGGASADLIEAVIRALKC